MKIQRSFGPAMPAATVSAPAARFMRLVALLAVCALVATCSLLAQAKAASAAGGTLLSQGKTATASSTENAGTPASAAVDGDTGTRWSSAFSDPQWLEVDLGSSQQITQVTLQWEAAYATAFQIQVSADNTNWSSIYSTTTGTGGTQNLTVSGSGRYVRMYGTARATQYGYSLWEFQVYGGGSSGGGGGGSTTCGTTNAAANATATASSTENAGTPASAAVDGNAGTRWSSAFSDPQWLDVDLGASQSICGVTISWEAAYATAFQIQVSADNTNWSSIYSTTTGTGGTQNLTVSGSGRYVRMYGTARATGYGYSIWEFEIFTGSSGGSGGGGTGGSGGGQDCDGATSNGALHAAVTASSTENAGTPASAAVDGNAGTRWSTQYSDPQWLDVDLGSSQSICGVTISWETAYATAFQIQVSADNTNWSTIYSTTTGTGGTQTLNVSGTGRYVRMYGTARATQWGYSIWEFEVFTPGSGGGGGPSGGGGDGGNGDCPWVGSTAPIADRVAQVMARMTQAQEIALLHGNGASSPYIGNLDGIPSLCIPSMGLEDGPDGVGDGLGGVTQMPVAPAAASTWDLALEQQYGKTVGAEFAGKGVAVSLGPTLNIVRDPRWGRAFETFSEDPYLSGQMAAADIQGIQSQGVMAQAKHVAVYNQETHRNGDSDNSIVDNKTMQEIYLPGFETAVEDGATASLMCGYSVVNGDPACQNAYLMNTAMYDQAGFGGWIGSDWGGAHSTVESANAGMTMEMPNGYFYADFLAQAVANGTVSQATLNTMVSRVLTQMFAFGLFDRPQTGSRDAFVSTSAHVATSLQVAEEGTVLLKNNGVLPLSTSNIHSIAVLGEDGGAAVETSGGGSGNATSTGTVWPLTGIQNRAGAGVNVQYEAAPDAAGIQRAVTLAQNSDIAVIFANNPEGEGTDLTSIDLSANENQLISSVAAVNPRTIVVLHTGSAVTMPWLNSVAAVFEGWYSGQEVGDAIAALLFGDVNPSGKLPVTFPASLADVPAHTAQQWPGDASGVQYSEGVDVGYRWYDAHNITPLFPFGFGLSYTSFAFSNLQVGALDANGVATVSATVKNTGSREGAEVVQLYVSDPANTGEPPKQLRNFARVDLQPGASQTVRFTVTAHDLAHFDNASNAWTTTSGSYQILVGDSSRNLPLSGTINVANTLTGAAALSPSDPHGRISVTNPHGMSAPAHAAVSMTMHASDSTSGRTITFSAQGLPAGVSISSSGVISGASTTTGTTTVTVIATDNAGATGRASFVWTTT